MTDPPSPSVYPTAVVVAVLSGVTVLLDIGPFIWHFKNRNLAAGSLVFWIMILNLTNFINAIVWPNDNVSTWWLGYGLCDIEVKLFVGTWVALTGALACIMRNLARVMDTANTVLVPSKAQQLRQRVIEIALIFAAPVILMFFHYIVQSNRYYLWAIAGCNPGFDNSWVSIVLIFIWPPIFSLIDTYYATLLVIRLHRYRTEFSRLLERSNTTKARFLRLFIMSTALIVVFTPLQFYILYANVSVPHHEYSWHDVHDDWQINPIPTGGLVLFDRWIRIGIGFLVFAFFGVGEDAIKMYRSWLVKLGLARIFPSLAKQSRSTKASSWPSNAWSSFSEKARLVFSKRISPHTTMPTDGSLTRASYSSDGTEMFSKRPKSWLSSGPQNDLPLHSVSLGDSAPSTTASGSNVKAAALQTGNVVITKELWQTSEK